MKVLFATDGSAQDQHARDFVAETRWPARTEIELFGVMRPVGLAVTGELVDRNIRDFEHELDDLATSLPQRDCSVLWRTGYGDPADEIAKRARMFEADLIVVGSRNRGPLATSILGSVSAGVIDRAPCPVLVARNGAVHRIVLADDGSVGAATAAALLQEWQIFGDASLQVVSVVDVGRPLSASGGAPLIYADGERLYFDSIKGERERAHETVAARAKRLADKVRTVKTSVREGDAADQILVAARDFAADLIVVGSRGQTGLVRFFAGSVARQVLHGAKCSVLIARGSAQLVHDRERTSEPGVIGAGATWPVSTL